LRDSVYVWLMGGLGNQLFQYNYAAFLQHNGYRVKIVDNLIRETWFTKVINWNIHEYPDISFLSQSFEVVKFNSIIPFIAKARLRPDFATYHGVANIPEVPSLHNFGYFQNKDFLLNKHISLKEFPHSRDDIVCHLRLSDSEKISQTIIFLEENLKHFTSSVDTFTVFTDSPFEAERVMKNLGIINYKFENLPVVDCFLRMISCRLFIGSDSTLSLWASLFRLDDQLTLLPSSVLPD
jgi:hypothetical protein